MSSLMIPIRLLYFITKGEADYGSDFLSMMYAEQKVMC